MSFIKCAPLVRIWPTLSVCSGLSGSRARTCAKPMNHILGFAQVLTLDPLNPEQTDSVGQILTSGAHLMKLIDRILAISATSPEDLGFLEARTKPPQPRSPGAAS